MNWLRKAGTFKPLLSTSVAQRWRPNVQNIKPFISLLPSHCHCQRALTSSLSKPIKPFSIQISKIPSTVSSKRLLQHLSSFKELHSNVDKTFLYQGKNLSCLFRLFHTQHVENASRQGGRQNMRDSAAEKNKTGLIYVVAIFVLMLGGAYAGVPLYKVFCQATGLGGQAVTKDDSAMVESMQKVERPIRVRFNADVASSMRWNFKPQQTEVTVLPGETALAFYTAKNPTDKPIIGISTYNVLPFEAGQYFNKIQCFCFEEQRLNPKEQVDMPVFFYIDPEFAEDPKLENTDMITLSYTFFEAVDGLTLPLPGYPQPHDPPMPATA